MTGIDPRTEVDYRPDREMLHRVLESTVLGTWSDALSASIERRAPALRHGNLPAWREALARLPAIAIRSRHYGRVVSVDGSLHDADDRDALFDALTALRPWRKGPYRIADIDIDCEWRSDLKWDRLIGHIEPLHGRTVLDVGCGSGYHLWRMREAGASLAVGIDPNLLFLTQFDALQHYMSDPAAVMLPLTLDSLPARMGAFDTVYSMGVLYHRREPAEHLNELQAALRPGGELILETLVSDSGADDALPVDDRYARMRNIWTLPSAVRVQRWLEEAGFDDVRPISTTITCTDEQRSTRWMPNESLTDALDPTNNALTVEGLPRPRRTILLARRPAS